MKTARLIAAIAALLISAPGAYAATLSERLAPLKFMTGEWVGEGTGKVGMSTGSFGFSMDLQNAALIRRSHSDFPATRQRAAFAHDDLLVVYPDSGGLSAFYYDDQGHAINFRGSVTSNSIIFLSAPTAGKPRYRLSYLKLPNGNLHVAFAIAPPNKSDAFETFVEGDARRK